MDWLEIHRGDAPLFVSFPHAGTDIPAGLEARFVSPWLARKDTDWWIAQLYDFVHDLGATTIRTRISRSVIDVNRDPTGASLYPGQATTELCPTTTFDGEPLYGNAGPDRAEIAARRAAYFDPYHDALVGELSRLRAIHGKVVLYEAHSIRSVIPRLFEGQLPSFNIGTHNGASCDLGLAAAVETVCAASGLSCVFNGRFKGGWTTRHYGQPKAGIHAIQMELACRGYMDEPPAPLSSETWPTPYRRDQAAPMRRVLTDVLNTCLSFARS
ncbi:MAG: N-formylglutamate deformylase [Rhodospirillaceae bacterium]|nr:N-formylglutamate deformylase [Rhodospirillaceae bacterium]